jgi:hypothetical protein
VPAEIGRAVGLFAVAGHVLVGRNARRVGDVDETRPDTFLFNHFVARTTDVALQL